MLKCALVSADPWLRGSLRLAQIGLCAIQGWVKHFSACELVLKHTKVLFKVFDGAFKHLISWSACVCLITWEIAKIPAKKLVCSGIFWQSYMLRQNCLYPLCSAQDGESDDMNCLAFWAHCKNGKILMKHQVYIIRGFHQFWIVFHSMGYWYH